MNWPLLPAMADSPLALVRPVGIRNGREEIYGLLAPWLSPRRSAVGLMRRGGSNHISLYKLLKMSLDGMLWSLRLLLAIWPAHWVIAKE